MTRRVVTISKPVRHRRPPADLVTPELHAAILFRDNYRCVAPTIDPDCGPCTGLWSDTPITTSGRYEKADLTIHHVQTGYGRMAKRAPSTMANCVTVCWGHHTKTRGGRIWATQGWVLSALREYLLQLPRGLGSTPL